MGHVSKYRNLLRCLRAAEDIQIGINTMETIKQTKRNTISENKNISYEAPLVLIYLEQYQSG